MRVIVFGASGMVGQGVLLACERAAEVTEAVAVVRHSGDVKVSAKVSAWVHTDFFDWSSIDLSGFDACFFCLGVTSVGMKEPEYKRVTQDLTIAVAEALLKQSPQAVFSYVSGSGTDASSKTMWARVKGETENRLLGMGFRDAYMFRPGGMEAAPGTNSKVAIYNAIYRCLGWILPLVRKAWPDAISSTEEVGRAMIVVSRDGWITKFMCTAQINRAAKAL
jgi:uncharacterized protein YbjT (DUF2867 family)